MLNLGNILISLGVGTIILEFFGFVDYIRERMVEVLSSDEYVLSLPYERMKRIKNLLEQKLYFPNIKIRENSLFDIVQEEILPLLKDCYFEEYTATIECSLDGDTIIPT